MLIFFIEDHKQTAPTSIPFEILKQNEEIIIVKK